MSLYIILQYQTAQGASGLILEREAAELNGFNGKEEVRHTCRDNQINGDYSVNYNSTPHFIFDLHIHTL